MAITLGGIELPKTTVWTDRQIGDPILQTRNVTLGGKAVVSSFALPSGRLITLEGQQDTGWITKDVYDSLYSLSATVGATYSFVYNTETYQVMFNHTDPPAISGSPLIYRNNQDGTDYYVFSIKLITV